jgi:predicted alpha/beta-fold hydrolase
VEIPLADGEHLLGYLHGLPGVGPGDAPLVIHFHGLGSHADALTQQGLSAKAFAAGLHSLRVNWRSAGGSEHLSTRIGAGLSHPDVKGVVDWARTQEHRRIYLTGFSLGAAVILNALARPETALEVDGAVCISPPLNFSAVAHALTQLRNRFYDQRFVWLLHSALRRYVKLGKGAEHYRPYLSELSRARSVLAFDDRITAPSLGLANAAEYYRLASPGPHLAKIQAPCWLLLADDDPFIPYDLQHEALDSLPADSPVKVTRTARGGHVGFYGARPLDPYPWEDGHWAENIAVRWILGDGRHPVHRQGVSPTGPRG